MKIELTKNWKEIAGIKDITYQRPPLTDSKLAPGVKPIPATPVKPQKPLKPLKEWVENKGFEKIWEKYVPSSGEAKTMFGEAARCLSRLEYDYYNNGYGNAYDSVEDDSNHYGDDDDVTYTYKAREYYADMGRYLIKFLKNKQAHADVISAANFVAPGHSGAQPWDAKSDPRFKRSVEILKNWFVENEKEHA